MLMQLTIQYETKQQAQHVVEELEFRDYRPVRSGTVVSIMRPDADPASWSGVLDTVTRWLG